MSVVLENSEKPIPVILARDLKDGQIGVILEGNYKGRIIQKYGNKHLVSIGSGYGDSFYSSCTLQVRILENGEKIVIQDNE